MSRAFLCSAILGMLASGGVSLAGEGPRAVIILGGGAKAGDGQAWIEKHAAALAEAGKTVKLAPGFPKPLVSDTVPGLKPGFHIAVAGFCEDADFLEPLELLKTLIPGTYARPVELPEEPLSCPTVVDPPEDTAAGVRFVWVNGLALRPAAALEGKPLARLRRGERVVLAPPQPEGGKPLKVTFHCVATEGPWVRIKRRLDGTVGFVAEGALSRTPLQARRVPGYIIVHNAKDCSDCGEDWGWFVGDVSLSARAKGIVVTGMTHGDRCIPLGPDSDVPEASFDPAARSRAGEFEDGEWTGYILVDPKGRMSVLRHDMSDAILREAGEFFGFEIPLLGHD